MPVPKISVLGVQHRTGDTLLQNYEIRTVGRIASTLGVVAFDIGEYLVQSMLIVDVIPQEVVA